MVYKCREKPVDQIKNSQIIEEEIAYPALGGIDGEKSEEKKYGNSEEAEQIH